MKIISLPSFQGTDGELIPIEFEQEIPFVVQRVYFLRQVPVNITRGQHAHFLEQEVFLCVQGQCTMQLDPDGQGRQEIVLNTPQKAVFVDTMEWHEFSNFSPDCVLLALSSTKYTPGESNYLCDYTEFQKIKNNE